MALTVRGLSEQEMLEQQNLYPGARAALERIRPLHCKGAIKEYQAGWLYVLTRPFNHTGARILEIGTLCGYSAAAMAEAAPLARTLSSNPNKPEVDTASRRLAGYTNVKVLAAYSWDYLALSPSDTWDMIFVDGDHKQVQRDLPWFNRLKIGGLMLFHDYSPREAGNPCIPVYEALEAVRREKRAPDVELVDNNRVGMAGWYRREGEIW